MRQSRTQGPRRGYVKNPIFRFLSKTVFSPTATIEKSLDALEEKLAS